VTQTSQFSDHHPGRDDVTQPAAAVLDTRHLATDTGGDRALQQEVLGVCTNHCGTYIRSLRESGGGKAWYEAAHTLKGAARGIGAWNLAGLCERAEHLARAGGPAERSIVLGDIARATDELLHFIGEHLNRERVA